MKHLERTGLVHVEPGKKFRLAKVDAGATGEYQDKESTLERLAFLSKGIADYQEKLYAEGRRSLLIVLQAMDTGGKDGAIKHLLTGINPAGVQVTSFKAPSSLELQHDFLWRIHAAAPARGWIGVWNRSHYEDVLVTRVHGLVDKEECRRRYRAINEFERTLVDNGTTICKFMLHISREEQKARLQARLDDPAKHWKFSPSDLAERKHWDAYMSAFQDALEATSTDYAPWTVVPANRKWARNIGLAESVYHALKKMDPQFPSVTFDPARIVID